MFAILAGVHRRLNQCLSKTDARSTHAARSIAIFLTETLLENFRPLNSAYVPRAVFVIVCRGRNRRK
jgi:hypothetical protein